jgi:uroporphyrinogen-III synthase
VRVAVTRPEGSAGDFAAALAARGHEAVFAPLLEIRSLSAGLPDVTRFQALLATSANAFLDCAAGSLRGGPPVFAVGGATADAARAAGAGEVHAAAGDGAALIEEVAAACTPGAGPLLYLCARDRRVDVAGALGARGFAVEQLETYAAETPASLPESLRTRLAERGIDAVSFFSPRTAGSFVRLIREAGLETACEGLTALCLSEAVAAELEGLTWRRVAVAAAPDREALLAALEAAGESG